MRKQDVGGISLTNIVKWDTLCLADVISMYNIAKFYLSTW